MADLLSWGKRLYDQVNPFDNGLTYKQRTPTSNRNIVQQVQRSAPGNIAAPFVRAAQDTVAGAYRIGTVPVENARMTLAEITNNQQARAAAASRAAMADDVAKQFIQGIPRIAYQVGQSANPVGGDVYERSHTPTGIERLLLGDAPIPSMQKAYKDTKAAAGSGQAGSEAVLTALTAATLLKGAGKLATKKPAAEFKVNDPYNLRKPPLKIVEGVPTQKSIKINDPYNLRPQPPLQVRAGVPVKKLSGAAQQSNLAKSRPSLLSDQRGSIQVPGKVKQNPADSYAPSIPKTPNVAQKMFGSISNEYRRMGPTGSKLADGLKVWRDKSEVNQAAFYKNIQTSGKLGREFPAFVDALDKLSRGEKPVMSPKVTQAVKEWSTNIQGIPRLGNAVGLKIGDRGQFYFPRRYSQLLKSRDGLNAAADHLVKTGQVADKAEALQALRYMKAHKSFGNFKGREFDLPGYDKDPGVIKDYISGAFDEIHKAEVFGAKGEKSAQILAKLADEGHDVSRAQRNLDIALGNVDKSTTGHKISGGIRKFNALRSLGTAGVSNITQLPVNTGTIAGVGRTLKGAAKTIVNKEARANAHRSGVLIDNALQNLSEQALGTKGMITRNAAAPFFKQIEKFNRQATAVVASDWGNALAKKATKGSKQAEATLRNKLGVTGEIGAKLTKDQEIQAMRSLVEKAQFKVDPMDLPGWVDSPAGKLVAQFRTFGYKQSEFMYNQVLREAMKGNFLPLTRFVAVGVPAGAAALATKGAIKGVRYTEDDESNASKASKAIAGVGGFGLPGSEAQNLYKSAQYDNLEGGIASLVGGPTASFGVQTSVNANKAIKGNSTPLQKQAVSSIPAVGSPIANRIFPKKPTEEEKAKESSKAYTIQTTKDGYKYTLEGDDKSHTTDSLASAREAIGKDKLKKSNENIAFYGNMVYRKAADGDVTAMPKIKYDYQLGTATLTSLKKAGDYKGWIKTAGEQLDRIDEQLKDPSIDPLEAITLQNQARALIDNIEKYSSYGGFKEGSAKSISTAGFKTASSSKVPSPPKIAVKKLSAPTLKSSVKKIAVSKPRSSYLSRKLS